MEISFSEWNVNGNQLQSLQKIELDGNHDMRIIPIPQLRLGSIR